jgi:glutathione S-transferase
MVLKLYGLHASHFVRLVAAILIEKQVPFELVKVDLSKGEQKTPEFLAKNPFGLVPCIVCHPLLNFFPYNLLNLFVVVTWSGR